VARLFRNANDRTSSRASAHLIIVLVEQLDTDDEFVTDLGIGEIASECLPYDLGGDMDALRSRVGKGRSQGQGEHYECQKACHVCPFSAKGF
jgi:hypothetical protein